MQRFRDRLLRKVGIPRFAKRGSTIALGWYGPISSASKPGSKPASTTSCAPWLPPELVVDSLKLCRHPITPPTATARRGRARSRPGRAPANRDRCTAPRARQESRTPCVRPIRMCSVSASSLLSEDPVIEIESDPNVGRLYISHHYGARGGFIPQS